VSARRPARVPQLLARARSMLRDALRASPRAPGQDAAAGTSAGSPTSGLWLDLPDAEERIAAANVDEECRRVAQAIRRDGLAVLRGVHARELCRQVIEDYERYATENRDYVLQNLDALGREKRLVNFHLWSDAASRIGTAPRLMRCLDFVFGREAAVYTSLTFKYGTQQPAHRDTPHFATWPANLFVGVWTALEDISPDAGPLFYHPGSHRFPVDPHPFLAQACERLPHGTREQQLRLALDLYNGEIIRRAPAAAAPVTLELAAGDSVIWHPDLPHGGLGARDPSHTRWSIVFHCSPADVQVHQHDRFFSHQGQEPPPARYGFTRAHGRRIALAGEVAFM